MQNTTKQLAVIAIISFVIFLSGCGLVTEIADNNLVRDYDTETITTLVVEDVPVLDDEGVPVLDDEGNPVTEKVVVDTITEKVYTETGPSKVEATLEALWPFLQTTGGKWSILAAFVVTAASGWYTKQYQGKQEENAKKTKLLAETEDEDTNKVIEV